MVKYRNPREQELEQNVEEIERDEEIMAVEPKTVQDANFKKRYDDARRGFQKFKEEKDAEVERLKRELNDAYKTVIKAPTSKEEIIEWQRKYPEFAGILEAIVQDRISDGLRESQTKLERIEEKQKELEVQEAVLLLKKAHPDFDNLINDEDFHSWLGKQTKKYQDAIYNDLDVDAASFVLDRYKSLKNKKSEKVEDRSSIEDAAKVVRTSSVAQEISNDFGDYEFSESQVDRESHRDPRWFAKNEDKIMHAYRNNRIKMDITGNAH